MSVPLFRPLNSGGAVVASVPRYVHSVVIDDLRVVNFRE